MFLRSTNRKKDGKDHRYFSVVENQRLPGGKTAQRTVLYLGEINDHQQAAWRKTLDVFDEAEQRFTSMSLFPDDRELPADAIDSIQVRLSGLELKRPRMFGNCWLACELWRQLGLDEFWQQRLPGGRETVSWEKVLQLLAVNRLLDPGSELRVHRHWYLNSAMDELLKTGFEVAEKDRLYRCLDRVLEHKQDLFVYLKQKWADLFAADFEVLLYDLTSTYFEGEMEQNPKARRGYSRDGRSDCVQLVIALVVTPDGFPLAYEVMNGNTADNSTLREFLTKVETTYGKARRVWVMDRGIPSEVVLQEMREPERQTFYLVGTPKSRINQHEKKWLDLPWQKVRDSVEVKLYEHAGELYVLAKSGGRQAKENAMRRKRLTRLLRKLRAMRKSLPGRDQLLLRIGAAKKEAGRAFGFVKIRLPKKDQEVTRASFTFCTDKAKLRAAEQRDGTICCAAISPAKTRRCCGPLCAVDADRERIPIAEERTGNSAHLSSAPTPCRCACIHRIPCLLPAGDAQEPAADSRAGSDAVVGVREAFHHSDGGGVDSDAGWPLAGAAAPHAAGTRCAGVAGADPHQPAPAAAAPHQILALARRWNGPAGLP